MPREEAPLTIDEHPAVKWRAPANRLFEPAQAAPPSIPERAWI